MPAFLSSSFIFGDFRIPIAETKSWVSPYLHTCVSDVLIPSAAKGHRLAFAVPRPSLRHEVCGLLVMQSQHLLPVTTVVFFIRFYVVGQVMSRELYSELWVCWMPALCTNCHVVCVSGTEGGRVALGFAKTEMQTIEYSACPLYISWFLSSPSLPSSFWPLENGTCIQKVPLISSFSATLLFLWLQKDLNRNLLGASRRAT